MNKDLPFVKTALIKISQPQTVEVGLNTGKVLRVEGAAARESINAIALAKQTPTHRATFGLPIEGGKVVVVTVDGKDLDATIKA